ncbi:MAG: portal protein, partial [Candidatus Dormibacteria bacterium]
DKDNVTSGIQTLVYIDARKIKKVRQITKGRDDLGVEIVTGVEEFYIYNDKLMMTNPNSGNPLYQSTVAEGVRLSKDSVVMVGSGIYDPIKATILSFLHKAIRPLNQLRFVEDATVIYRVSRAPERRVFYVDTGNLNKQKAEQYMKSIMTNYRNKLTYNASTGEIIDDRKHFAMLEDFWMPRRADGRTTEVTTLPAGQNLGQMEDVLYFKKQLYQALGVPASRIENPQGLFNIGQPSQITRDEVKFDKFIHRMRSKFSILFDELMERQLVLKQVCTVEEWKQFKQDIFYQYEEDNNFAELKDAELLNLRLQTLQAISPFMGVFFSKIWVWKNVVRMDDDEIKEVQDEMNEERQQAEDEGHPPLAGFPPTMPPGSQLPDQENGQPGAQGGLPQSSTSDGDIDNVTKSFLKKPQ